MKIVTEPDAINRRIERIRSVKAEIAKEIIQIEKTVNSLDMSWQGESERVFASKLLFVRREYDKLVSFYDELISLLQEVSSMNNELERTIVKAINQA